MQNFGAAAGPAGKDLETGSPSLRAERRPSAAVVPIHPLSLPPRVDDPVRKFRMHALQRHAMEGSAQRQMAVRSLVLAGAAVILTTILLVGVFLRLMNYELRRDEQLYVPPIRLLEDQSLYQDFFYNHTPGAAWWFHAVHRLVGSDHLLFDGRVGVFAAWTLFAVAIGVLAYSLTRSAWIAWSIAVLSLVNELFLTQTGMSATNNFLLLPFAFIGLGLFVVAVSSGYPRPWLAFMSGLFLSIAVVFKVSAIAFIFPAAVGAFLLPAHASMRERLSRMVLPLAGGGLIGGLPIIFYLLTDRARFLAHVLGYHLGPHARYYRDGTTADENAVTTLPGKLVLAHELWFAGTIAVALAALAIVIGIQASEDNRERTRSGALFVVAGAFCVSAALSLIPTPAFPQYFAPPLICLPLGLIVLVASLSPAGREQAKVALIAASVVAIVAQAPRLLQHAGTIMSPERWVVSRVHAAGSQIARQLASAKLTGKVATLAPIYPLEGGLPVYSEFATGPFAFRTAEYTPQYLGRFYRMISPKGLAELFDADPPAAFLLGFEPALERPLLGYAIARGYQPLPDFRVRDRYGTARLYVRSAESVLESLRRPEARR